jgi:hypothetical protein
MGKRFGNTKTLLFLIAALWAILALPPPSVSAEPLQPRRIAVAPFAVVGPDDVKPVAALLPRLLSSRLMALAAVDAPTLSASDKAPADAAREAGAGLLLQGTVSRLGKGYSIDVTVTDLASGKPAGAFFAAPANEDEIIPQVGRLAEDISVKLFDVKPTWRPQAAAPPPTGAAPPVGAPGGAPAATPTAQPGPGTPAPASDGAWLPSKIRKLAQSDKIADELFGVVVISTDAKGDSELVAWGKTTLYFYRVKAGAIVPWTRITRELNHHILGVEAVDLNDDGGNELLVTDRVNEKLESFVLGRKGDAFEEIAEKLPFYFSVLADRKGKRVPVGQYGGIDTAFSGRFMTLQWANGTFKEGEPLPVPAANLPFASGGVLRLSAARLGEDDRYLYPNDEGQLWAIDESGKTAYKGKPKFGWEGDLFEYGPYIQVEGRRAFVKVRQSPRVLPGAPGAPLLLAVQMKNPSVITRIAGGESDGSRLSIFRWEDGEFVERAASPYTDFTYSGVDLVSASGVDRNARIVASMIEQQAGMFKDRVSRLVLFGIE